MSSKVSMRLKFTALKMQCEQQDLAVTIVWMGGDQQQVLQVLSAAGGRVVREWLQEKKTDVWGCDS